MQAGRHLLHGGGLLLGRAELVEALRRHPFARALRVDKLTLAALEATLTGPPHPVALALSASAGDLLVRAEKLAAELAAVVPAEAVTSTAAVGGGGAPGVEIPSAAVALPAGLAAPLRLGEPPVVGYVARGRLFLDLITVPPHQDRVLAEAVRRTAGSVGG